MTEIRWHGRGGQGCFTAARMLGMAAVEYEKKNALAFPSFGPERRGAPVLGFTRIDNNPIYDRSDVISCDAAVFLDETLLDGKALQGLKENSVLLINTESPNKYQSFHKKVISIPASKSAVAILGRNIANMAMLGALAAITDVVSLKAVCYAIDREFPAKLAEKNRELATRIYMMIKET